LIRAADRRIAVRLGILAQDAEDRATEPQMSRFEEPSSGSNSTQ